MSNQELQQAATDLVVALKGHSLPRPAEKAMMSLVAKLSHTPGPWTTFKTFGGVTHIMTKDDKSIATLRGYKHPYSANARLIAAAPELLELLLDAYEESNKGLDFCGMPMISHQWHARTKSIIEKVTGAKHGNDS